MRIVMIGPHHSIIDDIDIGGWDVEEMIGVGHIVALLGPAARRPRAAPRRLYTIHSSSLRPKGLPGEHGLKRSEIDQPLILRVCGGCVKSHGPCSLPP
ncbi:hypothetical protein H2248_004255 [Termitomyces sp. 'cryptogamus']|nr:hypothetical protein H2248_004255 [Termitomyces sp. 'cryptogamus']